jgi:hypothetical protein
MASQRKTWLGRLDPGIAPYVDWLDSKGIETFESCEGGAGNASVAPPANGTRTSRSRSLSR